MHSMHDPQALIPQPILCFMVNRSPIFLLITKQPLTVHCSQSLFSQAFFCCYHNIYNYLPLHPAFRETQVHALLFQKEKGKPSLLTTSSHACVENQMHLCSMLTKIHSCSLGNEERMMIIFQIAFALAESPEIAARTGCPLGDECSSALKLDYIERKCGLFWCKVSHVHNLFWGVGNLYIFGQKNTSFIFP